MDRTSEDDLSHEKTPLDSRSTYEHESDGVDSFTHDRKRSGRTPTWTLVALLLLSILLNSILVIRFATTGTCRLKEDNALLTSFAGLARDLPKVFNSSSPYGLGSTNEKDRSILWESLGTSEGEISLDNAWAAHKGLPESAPFLWDEDRSIYLLNAHHSLHCMRKVRRWVTLSNYNRTQLDSYPHLVHCMDHVLQNILCEADDTPMYTSPKHNASTGLGQQRMCRDWDKLVEWADSQSSCFGYINETQGVDAVIKRFRYCPEDSGFLKPMRRYFKYDQNWYRPRPADIETIPRYWEGLE
ncbi:MAG: hypothetical protein M1831_004036 [Alyxoria varia]|nr:MAG: hypothetical protein M1831_004036 [Alyxoria varia]